jgi:hypothetical protein
MYAIGKNATGDRKTVAIKKIIQKVELVVYVRMKVAVNPNDTDRDNPRR